MISVNDNVRIKDQDWPHFIEMAGLEKDTPNPGICKVVKIFDLSGKSGTGTICMLSFSEWWFHESKLELMNIVTPSDKLSDLCKRAVDAWGDVAQIRMLQEECGECSVAINHLLDRKRENSHDNLCSEVADVLLSAMQVRSILGKEEVDAAMQYNLDRLDERLKNHGY